MSYSEYWKAIKEENEKLAEDPRVVFIGQQVASETFYGTLENISLEKRKEMPVAEEMQMGLSLGMSLEGFIPVSIFQRMDFLLRSADQLVNHMDKIYNMSRGIFKPKVIIRTTIGNKSPLDAGPQHTQDLCEALSKMITIPILKMETVGQVKVFYQIAREKNYPVILVEKQELYYNND